MSARSSSSTKRREKDAMKLKKAGFNVQLIDENVHHMKVDFEGPKDSPYHGFHWWVELELPEDYPEVPPLVKFVEPIFHPNIDQYGNICLDLLDSSDWNPTTELAAVISHYLPYLLLNPNPESPYNDVAAELYRRDKKGYEKKVEDFTFEHGRPK